MKKLFKSYFVIWAVLLVLFNIISFVSVGWWGQEKYTVSFWIGYISITVAFIGQLACSYYALNEDNINKTFYNVSLFKTSYTGLIMTVIFGGLCMAIPQLSYYVGIILCAIVLSINIIAVIKANIAVEAVGEIDDKIKTQTIFIKSLTVDAESLMARAKSEIVKAECKKVYEAVRYSDPMSHDALAPVESEITVKFSKLSDAVSEDDKEKVVEIANELVILIGDRNKKCVLLK
ncbi:MAG: hypothetical protein E7394_07660 [Ruminococcaceae bacterium]|nr:hypothetical protein [Oscillospiraceae bacterium]